MKWHCQLPQPQGTGAGDAPSQPHRGKLLLSEHLGSVCPAPCCPAPGRTMVGAGGMQPNPTGALGAAGRWQSRKLGSCGDPQAGRSGSRVAFEYGNLWC